MAEINASRLCRPRVHRQIARHRAQLWLEQNDEAIQYWNAYAAENGLPLEKVSALDIMITGY